MIGKSFVEHRGWQRDRNSLYVLDLYCQSKTNTSGLGSVQRAVVDYLATGPGGFAGTVGWPWPGGCVEHGEPLGVPVAAICRAAYGDYLAEPTAPQVRAVQRAVRRLEQLGQVDCWHDWQRMVERRYRDWNGTERVTIRPVSCLWVALRWDCEHLDRHRQSKLDRQRERQERAAQREATFTAALNSGDMAGAIAAVFGGAA